MIQWVCLGYCITARQIEKNPTGIFTIFIPPLCTLSTVERIGIRLGVLNEIQTGFYTDYIFFNKANQTFMYNFLKKLVKYGQQGNIV